MAEYLINDAQLWLSKLPESALNTHYTTNTDYALAATAQPFYILPQMEKRNDAGKPGNGHSYPTYVCNTYWSHPAVAVEDEINVELAGRLLLRAMGGTVADTTLATGVYKHAANQLPIASGRQYPSGDVIGLLGGASFLLAGMVVDRYRLSQVKADAPRFQCDMVGTGKHIRPHGVSSLPTSGSTIQCLDGNNTILQWTDTGGTDDWAASGRVRSWFVEVNNQTKLNDRRVGDPSTSNGSDGTAAYVRYLLRGAPQITAQIVLTLDSNVQEWIQMTQNELITDVTFKPQGPVIASSIRSSLAMIIPKARIVSAEPGEDDGDAIMTLNLEAYYDSTSGGAITGAVVNDTAANFK